MAVRVHPFPSRTRQLSSLALTILGWQRPGKIGRRQQEQSTGSFRSGAFTFIKAAASPHLLPTDEGGNGDQSPFTVPEIRFSRFRSAKFDRGTRRHRLRFCCFRAMCTKSNAAPLLLLSPKSRLFGDPFALLASSRTASARKRSPGKISRCQHKTNSDERSSEFLFCEVKS